MNEQPFRILTARKGYEYHLDDLRLTMFCTPPILQPIKDIFHFQALAITTPPTTFGAVSNMLPAGVVFQLGIWMTDEGKVTPIRFLHIEPWRIVIDVASSSATVDAIFSRLTEFLADTSAPDGGPVLGDPVRILNYSEISFSAPIVLHNLFASGIRTLFSDTTQSVEQDTEAEVLPIIQFRGQSPKGEFNGTLDANDGHTFTLSVRAATSPSEQVFFSGAPLDTDAHLDYLRSLTSILAVNK